MSFCARASRARRSSRAMGTTPVTAQDGPGGNAVGRDLALVRPSAARGTRAPTAQRECELEQAAARERHGNGPPRSRLCYPREPHGCGRPPSGACVAAALLLVCHPGPRAARRRLGGARPLPLPDDRGPTGHGHLSPGPRAHGAPGGDHGRPDPRRARGALRQPVGRVQIVIARHRRRPERLRHARALSPREHPCGGARRQPTTSATSRAGSASCSPTSSPTSCTSSRRGALPGFGRHVLGRAPYLFPNVFTPTWMIEGLAMYEETEKTAFGRGRNPDSRMVLRMAALEEAFPSEDQAVYAPRRVARRPGQLPLRRGLRALPRRRGGPRHRCPTPAEGQSPPGHSLPRRLDVVQGDGVDLPLALEGVDPRPPSSRPSRSGGSEAREGSHRLAGPHRAAAFARRAPASAPTGPGSPTRAPTLTRFPQIRLVRPDGSDDRRLADRNGGSGLSWTPDGKTLVYDELEVHRTYYRLRRPPQGGRGDRPGEPTHPRPSRPRSRRVARRDVRGRLRPKMDDRTRALTCGPGRVGSLARPDRSGPQIEWGDPRFSPDGRRSVGVAMDRPEDGSTSCSWTWPPAARPGS